MNERELIPYIQLVEQFVRGEISGTQFEMEYLKMFKQDPTQWTPQEYDILEKLFEDIDAFCPDPLLRQKVKNGIDEAQLKTASKSALAVLTKLLADNRS